MYYKDDWAKAREHLNQFWAGEDIGRPLAAVFAPRAKGCYVFPELHNGPWTGSNENSKTQEEIDKWWMDHEEYTPEEIGTFYMMTNWNPGPFPG